MPSYLGSNTHPAPRGISLATLASIGWISGMRAGAPRPAADRCFGVATGG